MTTLNRWTKDKFDRVYVNSPLLQYGEKAWFEAYVTTEAGKTYEHVKFCAKYLCDRPSFSLRDWYNDSGECLVEEALGMSRETFRAINYAEFLAVVEQKRVKTA